MPRRRACGATRCRPGLHRHAGARPLHRAALARRSEAPAGPRAAEGCRRRLQGRADQGPGRAGRRCRHQGQGGGQGLRDRPWRCRHRRHHLLHQHLQPLCAGRRRPGRPQGPRARPDAEALGEDLAGPRLAGRHRISEQVRPFGGSRRARLPDGRLWLHHLHRQFRPAGRRHRRGDRDQQAGRGLGALRQP